MLLERQLELDLAPRTWGGARAGAGRPRKARRAPGEPLPHRARPVHRKGNPVHVTMKVAKGLPSLRAQALFRRVEAALVAQRAVSARNDDRAFQVVHFSVQHDHLHLVVEAYDKRVLARRVTGLAIRITRQLNRLLGRVGRLWADRYHRHDLRTPTEVKNALRYVLFNAQKHHRVIGDAAFADPKSSAATFDGFAHDMLVAVGGAAWPRVEPRTWLLATGWRRHGRIAVGARR